MPTKKDHELLDTLKAAGMAIKWELGRYERRMMEVAKKAVENQVAKAIENGEAINALEISEAAVVEAKRAVIAGIKAVTAPAPRRARIAKR